MRLQDEPDIPPQINIVPMIDVIFAILTFFIMSSLFLTKSASLPVNLPKAATAKSQTSPAPATVTIDKMGNISLNKQLTNLDKLPTNIKNLMGNNSEIIVIINADKQATHGQVVTVMDNLRQVNGVKLAIATEKP
ncbi:biopolymer transporter ExbD [Anabaena sp. FACHB-1237]|uniref:ExbD/TolR family protein n=1 Tax=Anabaena sp. FACHB-1237 TaxID=2692769 RepID=UPI0016811B00|nr:biopolymer transporter ExbD [Anabaena sp. FACHB-1237]MBD2136120.1 biopolymer transporter ExbD [Anabaena sp. FACHB-1237]